MLVMPDMAIDNWLPTDYAVFTATTGVQMRAIVYDHYGTTDRLRPEDIPIPTPKPDQVLIKVAATSINLSDWESLTGWPTYSRIGGLFKPRRRVLGSDIAGVVEAVGDNVRTFRPGDQVYGDNLFPKGGFAEYVVLAESALAIKPSQLSFAEASTIPQAGAIAWQGTAGVHRGDRVLINGAGGGSGMFAIQLAKHQGAHVTGVDNERKLDHMRQLGANEVIDYQREDFTARRAGFDVILDFVAHGSVFAYRRALAPGGRYRLVGGSTRVLMRTLAIGPVAGRLTGRHVGVLAVRSGPQHFAPIAERCAAGEVRVYIDRTFTLDEVPQALAYVGEGRALGKVVVTP